MFKPLLRTIPCLSGNFTLACKLDNYKKNSPINFECGISNAVLMPLQNNLANKHINVSLLYDSYEYDIKEYYKSFSSIFYNENYEYDKNNIYKLDLSKNSTYKNRNLDYEFGCKRNIMNSGYQYMFYAPFYINNTQSLPDEFVIHIDFDNNRFKEIHIKIFDDNSEITNYLSVYLKRYIEQIDERCIFCLPETNQGSYYGVDVQYGGFKNVRDNVIGVIYNKQLSINDYDKIICNGFQRNKLIMKQIIPLSFMFNIEDILTTSEYRYNINNIVRISGQYERNGMKYDFYDFDTDYKELIIHDVNILNPENAINDNKNLRNSLYEAKDELFKYDNTISKTYNRWCLLSTLNNENKYITNSSDVFLDKNDNYYDTPIRYTSNSSYLYYDNNDINLELSRNSLENNNLNSIVTQTTLKEQDILKEQHWHDVFNNKCLIGGILYDLNESTYTYNIEYSYAINAEHEFNKYQKIDKFNVFAYINVMHSDDSYYCKYSATNDDQWYNGITYNDYSYPFFKNNIVNYSSYYEKYHLNDTLFNKLTCEKIDDIYVFKDSYNNVVEDNIYIDYSYHYYLSNLYENYEGTTYSKIAGYEILNDIEPLSFINSLSKDNQEHIYLKKIISLMNYSSENTRPLSVIDYDDDINDKNSRLCIKRGFINVYEKYLQRDGERSQEIPKYRNVINNYFHYVPSYKSASFTSRGHFEKNNVHDDFVYCDMWNFAEYLKEWNDEHQNHEDRLPYINASAIVNNAYIGFINEEQYSYYSKRMYDYDYNNMKDYSYVLISYAVCNYNQGLGSDNLNVIKNIKRVNSFVKYSDYEGNESTEELIRTHRLYHKNKIIKLSSEFAKKIISIYNKHNDYNDDTVSLILYTTNTDFVDKFKVNKILTNVNINNEQIYIPLSKEILWSKKSQKETYDILASRNVKLNDEYVKYDIYDLTNCNYAGDIDNCRDVCENDESLINNFYRLVDVKQIESDNQLHIVNKNGINYAYYYITLNLFNNSHSFIMNTNDINNTFDISNYSLNELIPYLSSNLLDYILMNMGSNSIVEKNIINVLMNKYFDKSESTVIQNTVTTKQQMSRYFNDITPVLLKVSSLKPYSLLYNINDKNSDVKKNSSVIYNDFNERNIEYDSNIYENKEFGIPTIMSSNNIDMIEEYEYKFYNDNKLYLLETSFTIIDKTYYTIEEIREHETNDYVLNNVFKPRILKKIHNTDVSDDEILFLFNRYKVEYESYPIRTDLTGTYKLHKLKYIFTLI